MTAQWWRRAILAVTIVAAQFGIFEVALRTWGSSEAAPAFQGLFDGDPQLGYRLKPHARTRFVTSEFATDIAVNGAGFRDEQELGPKPANERRILLLGDSLVLSVQVPFSQTFGELLEERLNRRAASVHYRVVNAGVQGYGPVEELLYFKKIVGTVQPDLVIVVVFVGNDAEEAVRSAPKLRPDAPDTASLRTRLRRVVRRSMVLQIVRLRVVSATDRFTPTIAPPEAPLQSYSAAPAPRIAEGLAISRTCIDDINQAATTVGARTAVVLMPARFQVDDGDYGRLVESVTAAGGSLVRDGASDRFRAALAPLNLPLLDVLPDMRRTLPGPDLFFQQTVHLTPHGHEVVAASLDPFVAMIVEP
jgi:lysophospholipase L1-like esterase